MKIRVDIEKLIDCMRIVVTVIETEEIFSNKLFRSSLDYPSDIGWSFIENKDNINYIENLFYEEDKAKMWADTEIKCLKEKLNI